MKHSDDWIEDRIRFRAGRAKLPIGRTCFFTDASSEVRAEVEKATKDLNTGTPVLLGYDSPNRWSLISTRQFVGFSEGSLCYVNNCGIAYSTLRDYPPKNRKTELFPEEMDAWMEEMGRFKQSWEYLQIKEKKGVTKEFWVPAGSEAFAFMSILLMLTCLNT